MMMRCINKKVLMEAWEREAGIGKGDEGNGGGGGTAKMLPSGPTSLNTLRLPR